MAERRGGRQDERQLWVRRIVRFAVILLVVALLLWLLQSEAEPGLAGLAVAPARI